MAARVNSIKAKARNQKLQGRVARLKLAKQGENEVAEESKIQADNWAHRSKGMTCVTCMWFVFKLPVHTKSTARVGRCRKHAPTMTGWPVMFETDWCGDHKLDEERLT